MVVLVCVYGCVVTDQICIHYNSGHDASSHFVWPGRCTNDVQGVLCLVLSVTVVSCVMPSAALCIDCLNSCQQTVNDSRQVSLVWLTSQPFKG